MARNLWRLPALLTVLLAVTDATNAAVISIIGGNVMNIGDKAEIQCSYPVHPFYKPTFIINGVSTDLQENKDGLAEYAHNRSSIDCPYALFGYCTVYTLTLSSVSRDYNGTTYQCHAWRYPSGKSGNVTLIVRDPATEEPTADKDSTPRTESTGNNTTNNMSSNIPDTPTPAPTPTPTPPEECQVQGEEYFDGVDSCVPYTGTCEEPTKVCTLECRRGCGCPVGTVLDEEANACVNVTDCPKDPRCPRECSRRFCQRKGPNAECSVPGSTGPACTGACHVTRCRACYYSKEVRNCPVGCRYACGEDPNRKCVKNWSKCVKDGFGKMAGRKKANRFKCVDPCTCCTPGNC